MESAYAIKFNGGFLRAGYSQQQSLYMATLFETSQKAQEYIDRRREFWVDMDNAEVVEVGEVK